MKVRLVQTLGDRLLVYFATPHHDHIVAQMDGYAQLKLNDTLPVYIDMERALFFAAGDVGARISGPNLS
jgi:hypothetical protein